MALDWQKIVLTEHMTEAAEVVAECQVVIDFGPDASTCYEIKVYRVAKGDGEPFFAVGVNRDPSESYRPVASGATAEDALQTLLTAAAVHHRRHVKQKDEGPAT